MLRTMNTGPTIQNTEFKEILYIITLSKNFRSDFNIRFLNRFVVSIYFVCHSKILSVIIQHLSNRRHFVFLLLIYKKNNINKISIT